MKFTTEQQATLNAALGILSLVAPAIGPTAALVAGVVGEGISAITAASNGGHDVTDEQLESLFIQFEANDADDAEAQAEARRKG